MIKSHHAPVPRPRAFRFYRLANGRRRMLGFWAVLWASSFSSHNAFGATVWINSTLGNWFIASNWSDGVPDHLDRVFIPAGAVLVSSPTSAVSSTVELGSGGGNGSLFISNGGGFINAGGASIGQFTGSNSAVTVSGAGSQWQTDFLTVGGDNFSQNGGNGTLRVESGGWVRMEYGRLGFINGSNGSATVTGANSLWDVINLAVGGRGSAANGLNGAGTLQIASGGRVNSGNIQVYDTGSAQVNNGSSTVPGLFVMGGSVRDSWGWDGVVSSPLGGLTVGNTASGRMVVQTGGTVSNSFGTIGATSGTVGSVLVQGAGSTWTNTDQVSVGHGGTGMLEVRNGGTLNSVRGFAGANVDSTGTIIVSDPGSTWNASGSFFIGNSGYGFLEVLNGGAASTAGNSYLGFSAGSFGAADISGPGSTWNTAATLAIGGNLGGAGGGGRLTIADGGDVSAAAITLYSSGEIYLNNTTTLTGPITSFGGRIHSTAGDTALSNNIDLGSGLLLVHTNSSSTALFSGNLSGVGGLLKNGSGFGGVLTLTGNNSYTGATIVNVGTLLVNGRITSATTVNSGTTLGGSGTIAANVTNNGIVAPGNSPGTLHIDGNYTQNAGGTLKIELASPTSFDRLTVAGAMALGGRLEISLVDGFIPTADQTFDIFSFSNLSGAFSSVILPLQVGLTWDASQLATGVISVDVASSRLAADFDENGVVDGADLARWKSGFGTGTTHEQGHADGDSDVDGADFLVWQQQVGGPPPATAASAAVPEPTSLGLLLASAWLLFASNRRAQFC